MDLVSQTYTEYVVPQEPDNIRGLGGSDTWICTDDDAPNAIYVVSMDNPECYIKVVEEGCEETDEDCESGYGGTEFAGISFTPDKKSMYFAVQARAVWVVEREDGLAFDDWTNGLCS